MTNAEAMKIPEGYKQTEVGVIPEEWETKPLSELTTLMTNGFVGTAKTHYTDSSDGVLYIQGYNVEENSFNFRGIKKVTQEFHLRHSKSCLREGDVLMVQTGDVGLTTVVPKDLVGSNCHALIISRFKTKQFNPLYFSYFLNSKDGRSKLKDLEVGTTMKHINVGDLLHFMVPVPSNLKEQTAIANALSDVDNLIAALETLIAKKSAIKTAAMQQLLTGKKRLPAFEGKSEGESAGKSEKQSEGASDKMADSHGETQAAKPSSEFEASSKHNTDAVNTNNQQTAPRPGYKHTELGEIPEDWEVKSFSKIAKPKNNRVNPKVEGGGDLCIELEHIGQGTGSILGNTVTSNNSSLKNIFEDGDVLFGKLRSYLKKYWLADFMGVCSTEIWVLESNRKRITPEYLFQVVRLDSFIECTSESYGTHMPRSDWKVVKEYLVPLPSLEEQTAIANVLSDMDAELDALQQRLSKTQKIKQGMMQELLTGKTRLV